MFNNISKLANLKEENKRLRKDLQVLDDLYKKETKILKSDIKSKNEVIEDLDRGNYKEKYKSTATMLKNLVEIDKEKDTIIEEKNNQIEELKKKVSCLEGQLAAQKVKVQKDSSNSSKPSSTNGFKKVITNSREKSDKPQGGQVGHVGTTLTEKDVEKMIVSGEAEVKVVEINKTDNNKDRDVKIRKVIDVKLQTIVTIYKYYPDENGNYDIPKEHSRPVQYGSELKAICTDLLVESTNSTDAVKKIISSLTNNVINLSKGTLINWLRDCSKGLTPQLISTQENLLKAYYINADELTITVNGQQYYVISVCNKEYTRFWISPSKKSQAIIEIDFMPHYNGKIVKDGTNIYNGFGAIFAQCISHILRYIKGVYDFNCHEYAKAMAMLIKEILEKREEKIEAGEEQFTESEYKEYIRKIQEVFNKWKKEWMYSEPEDNAVYEDERKLLQRFEDKKEFKQIFHFMTDFKIPPTNNQVESDQRPIKIRQKIGKFRSEAGAVDYANIRSCVNTWKKQGRSPFKMLQQTFEGNLIPV